MAYYRSLREYVEALDKAGKLVRVTTPLNKDTQLAPLLYLQERGLPEEQHKVFFFTNVFDSRGNKYDIPVAYAALRTGFGDIGLKCQPKDVNEKVAQARVHPIEPRLVDKGPVQEVVYMGDRLLEKGGMDEFPVPITHPGWDGGPVMAASCWVTKDPDTGIRNVGVYRSHVYARDRLGIHMAGPHKHIQIHWQKARARGIPLQAAIVIGGPPNLVYVATTRLPYGMDEYAMAGALVGEPVELVKCKTVDLEVPANADVVIEGELTTEWLELEGPHGEGGAGEHMSMGDMQPYFTIKCITHRKNPIWYATARGAPSGGLLLRELRDDLNMPHVLATASLPSTAPGSIRATVIKVKSHTDQAEVWRTLEAVAEREMGGGTYIIAVDEDIDIRDQDMVWWAMSTRAQPHRDLRITRFLEKDMKPVYLMPEPDVSIKVRHRQFDPNLKLLEASRLLINATMKWPYPPVCLPAKQFMEGGLAMWQELGLPPLKLREPWYGYELGYWPDEYREAAERAVKGEYYKTSEMRAKNRVKVDYPPGGY